jgi:hypothetical protein
VSGRTYSPAKKAKAARCFREGMSLSKTSKQCGVPERTLSRWKVDPDFMLLLHSRGVLQVGAPSNEGDQDAGIDDPGDMSMLWVHDAEILGALQARDDAGQLLPLCRIVFVPTDEVTHVQDEIAQHRFPLFTDATTAILAASALQELQDSDELDRVTRLFTADPLTSFLTWCSLWRYRAGETKDVRTLAEMWEGQRTLAERMTTEPHTFLLKARKLGASEISVAFAGFCARIRDRNASIGMFSYRERAANALLTKMKFGMDGLPAYLRLPQAKDPTLKTLDYDAGPDDTRSIQSFPMSTSTSVEQTFTHVMLDEFAHWKNGEAVFAALEPTYTSPGATSEILTTGRGPVDWSAEYWRRCKDGDGIHVPLFIPATARPGRDADWMANKRRTMTKSAFRTEYALEESDALAGTEGFYFEGEDVDHVAMPMTGDEVLQRIEANEYHVRQDIFGGARFITGVDLGVKDATVIVTLAILRNELKLVVKFQRVTGYSYPAIQNLIEQCALDFPRAPLVIEANSMGATVIGNLNCPAWQIVPFHTTQVSKARVIEGLSYHLEQQLLKAHPDDCPALFSELRGYTVPDAYVQQDAVMATAIAIDQAPVVYNPGRVMAVVQA